MLIVYQTNQCLLNKTKIYLEIFTHQALCPMYLLYDHNVKLPQEHYTKFILAHVYLPDFDFKNYQFLILLLAQLQLITIILSSDMV